MKAILAAVAAFLAVSVAPAMAQGDYSQPALVGGSSASSAFAVPPQAGDGSYSTTASDSDTSSAGEAGDADRTSTECNRGPRGPRGEPGRDGRDGVTTIRVVYVRCRDHSIRRAYIRGRIPDYMRRYVVRVEVLGRRLDHVQAAVRDNRAQIANNRDSINDLDSRVTALERGRCIASPGASSPVSPTPPAAPTTPATPGSTPSGGPTVSSDAPAEPSSGGPTVSGGSPSAPSSGGPTAGTPQSTTPGDGGETVTSAVYWGTRGGDLWTVGDTLAAGKAPANPATDYTVTCMLGDKPLPGVRVMLAEDRGASGSKGGASYVTLVSGITLVNGMVIFHNLDPAKVKAGVYHIGIVPPSGTYPESESRTAQLKEDSSSLEIDFNATSEDVANADSDARQADDDIKEVGAFVKKLPGQIRDASRSGVVSFLFGTWEGWVIMLAGVVVLAAAIKSLVK